MCFAYWRSINYICAKQIIISPQWQERRLKCKPHEARLKSKIQNHEVMHGNFIIQQNHFHSSLYHEAGFGAWQVIMKFNSRFSWLPRWFTSYHGTLPWLLVLQTKLFFEMKTSKTTTCWPVNSMENAAFILGKAHANVLRDAAGFRGPVLLFAGPPEQPVGQLRGGSAAKHEPLLHHPFQIDSPHSVTHLPRKK